VLVVVVVEAGRVGGPTCTRVAPRV